MLIMCGALDNNSSLLPLKATALGIIEAPIFGRIPCVGAISWMCRESLSRASAGNVTFSAVQGIPNNPAVSEFRFAIYEEIFVVRALQFVNLGKEKQKL